MTEEKEKSLTIYIMGEEDIHIGMTGKDEAPLALVIPKAGLGIGLPIPVAARLHDALCDALAILQESPEEKLSFVA